MRFNNFFHHYFKLSMNQIEEFTNYYYPQIQEEENQVAAEEPKGR